MHLGVCRTVRPTAWPQAFRASIVAVVSGRGEAAHAQWLLAMQLRPHYQRPLADYYVPRWQVTWRHKVFPQLWRGADLQLCRMFQARLVVSLRTEWSAQGQYREQERCGIQQGCSRNNTECSETYPPCKERENKVDQRYSRCLSVCRI